MSEPDVTHALFAAAYKAKCKAEAELERVLRVVKHWRAK